MVVIQKLITVYS
ncbi:hypothetical protein FWK35_00036860 [Aphis craccivora]|uniref:Uncharacterized protein n=1 Tax=Aphis craccivora TaxID=307492 RepID=A0A6G0W1G4_APHCR|nr:hypothetical protein FWK35_00036860 [Aphis craccivora]